MAVDVEEPSVQGVPSGLTEEPIQQASPGVRGVPPGLAEEPLAQASAPVQRAQPATPPNWRDKLTETEPLATKITGVPAVDYPLNALANFGSGVLTPILHPIKTAESMGQAIVAGGMAPGGMYPTTAPTMNPERDRANQQVQSDAQEQIRQQAQWAKAHPGEAIPAALGSTVTGLLAGEGLEAAGGGYSAFRSGLAARLGKGIPTGAPVPDAAVAPPPVPEVSAPTPDVPDQPGGPAGPGGGPAPAPTEPRPSAGSTGNPAAPQQPAGPATQPAQPGKPTITLEHEPSLLDQVAAHTEALDRARAQTEGASPADIRALRDAVEETGRRAHDAGDMATVEKAAHADIALSQLLDDAIRATNEKGAAAPPAEGANLNAAAAALTGKPISDVAAGKGGFTWDDQKPGGPKPVTPDKIAAVLGTAKAPIPPQAAPTPLQPATAQATNQPQPVGAPEPATGRPILQATDNPATLQQAAEAQAPWLEQQANATVQGINGAKVDAVREKKEAADLGEKLNKEGQPAATIPDYLGGRIIVDSPAARDQVVQRIRQTMPVVKETDNFEKGSDPYGFHAHTFQVRTPDGNSAELQVVPKEQADVNDQTHGLYEKGEKARIAGDQRMHQKIAQVVRSTHDVAMQAFNARNHIARDMAAKQGTDAASVAQQNQQQAPAPLKPGDSVNYPTSGGKMRPGKVVRIDGDNAYVRDGFTTVKKPLAKLKAEGAAQTAGHRSTRRGEPVPEPMPVGYSLSRLERHPGGEETPPPAGQETWRAHTSGGAMDFYAPKGIPTPEVEDLAAKIIGQNLRSGVPPERIFRTVGKPPDKPKDVQDRIVTAENRILKEYPPFTLINIQNQASKAELSDERYAEELERFLRSKPSDPAQLDEATSGKWTGVDLDGTLAHYDGYKGPTVIGEPIAPMVDRVKGWLKEGKTVKILTARVSEDPTGETKRAIQDWTEKHIGQRLDVTDVKDAHMTALYDDRAVPVERNTGKLLAQPQPEGNQNANESRNGSESPAATAPSGEGSDKDAVRVDQAKVLLQREPGQDRPEGSGRIQPGEQGQGTSGAGAGSEAKPLGRPGGREKPESGKIAGMSPGDGAGDNSTQPNEGTPAGASKYLPSDDTDKVARSVHDRLEAEGYRVFPLKSGNIGGSRYLDVFPYGDNSPDGGITLRFSTHRANIGGRFVSESGRAYDENDVASYEQAIERLKAKGIKPKPSSDTSPAPAKGAEHKYKFGNTQADIPADSPAGRALAALRAKIDPADLMGEGLVEDSHITVRYGIQGDDTAGIRAYLEKQAPFEAELGQTDEFPASEHSDGAVPIIVPIESVPLRRMEKEIDQHGDFAERSFPDYKPHVTVAYVKPEAAHKYVGDQTAMDKTFTVKSMSITDRDGGAEEVPLKGKAAPSFYKPKTPQVAERAQKAVSHPPFTPGQHVRISGEGFQDMRGNAIADDEGTVKKFTPEAENHGFNTAVIVRPDGNETRISWADGKEPPISPFGHTKPKPAPKKPTGTPEEKATAEGELAELLRRRDEVVQKYQAVGGYTGEGGKELSNQNVELTKQIRAKEDELAKVNGEPTRDERKAMQEAEATKPFDERPSQAMKYDQPQQSQHWQVMEPDYATRRFEQQIAQYERAVKSDAAEVEKARAGTKAHDKAKVSLDWRRAILKRLKDRDEKLAQQFKHEYLDLVKKAISKGSPVPDSVIAQYSEFRTARDARERYEKGRHTSFANRSAAINDTMQKQEGFKAKRQDGKAITDAQINEIKGGIEDIAAVLGADLRDMMRGTDLTIAHTNGKHPFLSDAGGMYHPGEKSISAGIENWLGQPVRALAHEVGHWFDYESGKVMGADAKILRGGKRVATAYASEADADKLRYAGYGERVESMYSQALKTMTDTREVVRMLKVTKLSDLNPETRSEVERTKVVLGHYWREPRELFARLFEQYISEKLGRGGLASETPELYHKSPGWWSKGAWATLEPMVEAEVNKRLVAMRERYAPKAPEPQSASATAPAAGAAQKVKKAKPEEKPPEQTAIEEHRAAHVPGEFARLVTEHGQWADNLVRLLKAPKADRKDIAEAAAKVDELAPQMERETGNAGGPVYAADFGYQPPVESLQSARDTTQTPVTEADAVAPGTAEPTQHEHLVAEREQLKKVQSRLDKEIDAAFNVSGKRKFGSTVADLRTERAKASDRLRQIEYEIGLEERQAESIAKREALPLTKPEEKIVTDPDQNKWKFQAEYFIKALEPVKQAWIDDTKGAWDWDSLKNPKKAEWAENPKPEQRPKDFPNDFIRIEVPGDGKFLVKNAPPAIDKLLRSAPSAFAKPSTTVPGTAKTSVSRAPKELEAQKLIDYHREQVDELEKDLKRAGDLQREYIQEQLKAARENLEDAQEQLKQASVEPQSESNVGNTFYSGFGDPELFKQLFPALADSIAQWASNEPTTASTQKEIMRQKAGEMDRRIAIAVHMLRRESKGWRTRSHDDSIKFWNAVEQGRLDLIDPKDRHLAEVFKQAFDSMRAQLQRLKPEILQNYIENYFPHIWERPSMARAAIRGYLTGKRPLQGKAAFLKKRTIPTMQDGLDLGFTPQSWNPVDSFLLKYAEMAQFLMGHQVLDVMKKAGTAKFVRISDKPPDGWKQLDDRIGTVYRRVTAIDEDKLDDVTQPLTWPGGKRQIPGAFSEDIEDATHGEIALVGHYYAPADAAKVFNNYVSKGLSGRFAIFDVVRWMNSNLNALQLGVSAFHASMITGVGAVSDIALGVQQLTEGKPVDFAAKVGRGILFPISALNTVRNGYRLMKEYLHPGSYAAMAKEAAAVATAGGRLKENTLQIKPLDKAINSFANGAILKGLSAVPGALLQTFTGPIMDHYVPLMKFGIFYGLAHDILDEQGRGKITAQAAQTRLNEAWNSVDNRAGQMVYRNLFWDRATLDLLQVATRSVGWNYGTIAEAGAALSGTGKAAVDIARGKKPRLTPAMAFAIALPLTMGMWGAAANYMRTGHAPETWKDYFYLRNSDGTYLAPPTYMKDVFSYAHDPAGTFANKLGPLWEATSEAVRNKDFYGTEIRHKDDPMVEQMAEVSKWAAKQAIPFAFSSAGKTLERRGAQDTLASMIEEGMKHPGDVLAGQLGFTPAPAFIQNSEALNKAREYQAENAPPGTRTKEQAERTRAMRVIENMYRTRTVDTSAIREMVKSGVISERDRFHAQLESRTDPLVRAVRSLHPEQALNVYRSATAEEKKELRPVIEAKEREINNDVPRDQKEALKAAFRTALHPQPRFTGPSA